MISRIIYLMTFFVLMNAQLIEAQAFEWVKTFNPFTQYGICVAADPKGNSYIAGLNIVTKYDNSGNCLWSTYIGGEAHGITYDANGNVYITGFFSDSAQFGAFTLTSYGGQDIFIAKFDNIGNCLWVEQAGGSLSNIIESGESISLDASGNVNIIGSASVNARFGQDTIKDFRSTNIFLAKYSNNGKLIWVKAAGGNYEDYGNAFCNDALGNFYITGVVRGTVNFDTLVFVNPNLQTRLYVAKYSNDGSCNWVKVFGGAEPKSATGISADSVGNLYLTGYFANSITFGDSTIISKGGYDLFIAKFDSEGKILWAKGEGGAGDDHSRQISVEPNGNFYITGDYIGRTDLGIFAITSTVKDYISPDIFFAKVDKDGNFLWAQTSGSTDSDLGKGISVSPNGYVYATGRSGSETSFGNFVVSGIGYITKIGNASLNITSPAGNEVWQTNTTHNITWNSVDDGNIKIEITTDNGANWFAVQNTYSAKTGNYAFAVPPFPYSTQCMVRLTSLSYGKVSTSGAFKITAESVPAIKVTAPNSAVSWKVGSTQNLSWALSGSVDNVKLEYTTNNGNAWNVIVNSTPAAAQNYSWLVPLNVSKTCFIRASDAVNSTTNDVSDTAFTIYNPFTITSPRGGENWNTNTQHNITWTMIGTITNVKLDYSTDNGGSWNSIVNSTPASTLSFSWLLPNTISKTCKIKISEVGNPATYNISDANFEISTIEMSIGTPTGDEKWMIGSTHYIQWSTSGQSVNLYYSTDNGNKWNVIASNQPSSVVSYLWKAPNFVSSQYKIKVEDVSNPTVFITSGAFAVWQPITSKQLPVTGQNSVSFGLTNLSFSAYVLIADTISVIYYPYLSAQVGTLPSGVNSISAYFWAINSLSISFFNGVVSVPVSTLRGVNNSANLVWLKRKNTGEPWTNLGGSISGDNLVSTNTAAFNSFSEFAIGSIGNDPLLISEASGIPKEHKLLQNYPNPFNPSTTIKYGLPKNSHVIIKIYNSLGQCLETLADETQSAGYHSISWNGSRYSSGIYFYELKTDGFKTVKKLLLMK